MIYAGVLTYLRRYLGMGQQDEDMGPLAYASFMMALILLCGCIGQYLAGRFARSRILELQLTLVCLANAPFLVWMSMASGTTTRYIAAIAFSFLVLGLFLKPIMLARAEPSSVQSSSSGFAAFCF